MQKSRNVQGQRSFTTLSQAPDPTEALFVFRLYCDLELYLTYSIFFFFETGCLYVEQVVFRLLMFLLAPAS